MLSVLCHILTLDPETKTVFADRPFVSFRSPRNLKSYLVRAKLYPEKAKTPGSGKCGGKICHICANIVTTNVFTSSGDKETFKINHPLNCNSKDVIYLLTCKVCDKKYVGETNKFRNRWNNYISKHRKAAKGENVEQLGFHQHFLDDFHHGLKEDCLITLIDKTNPHTPTERENFWITTLNTMHPVGLNTVEEYSRK